jgi:hypothetical protein
MDMNKIKSACLQANHLDGERNYVLVLKFFARFMNHIIL